MGHLPALDGLRTWAVLLVVISHASLFLLPDPWKFRGLGKLGVDIFFVLSGYLVTRLLALERDRVGRIDLPRFHARRALRIWPLYYGLLLFYGVTGLRDVTADVLLPWFPVFLQTYMLTDAVLWLGVAVLWSIAVEEHFYLGVSALLRWGPRVTLGAAVVLIAGVGVALRVARELRVIGGADELTHFNIGTLALGSVLAFAHHEDWPWLRRFVGARWARWAGTLLLSLNVVSLTPVAWDPFPSHIRWSLSVAAATLLVAGNADAADQPRTLRARPMVTVGRWSFGIYLLHPIVIALLAPVVPGTAASAVPVITGVVVLSVAAAGLSYRFYESPFLRLKKHVTPLSAPGEQGWRADQSGLPSS